MGERGNSSRNETPMKSLNNRTDLLSREISWDVIYNDDGVMGMELLSELENVF